MFFASDNGGPAHPKVIEAVVKANEGYTRAYGAEALAAEVQTRIRDLFDAPEAAVYLVATGTACNALILATLCPPWGTVYCTPEAHIEVDECNAPEFFTGGAKLTLVESRGSRMLPDALAATLDASGVHGVHGAQPGPVSITSLTERGAVYGLDEIRAIAAIARDHGLDLHLDGARFGNACAALGCTAAEMTTRAGVTAVSFGGTKGGCLGVEAAVILDPAKAWEFELRRKRAGHLFSKHRYLSAQMAAYLEDDLWLDLAAKANAKGLALAEGMASAGYAPLVPPAANMVYVPIPTELHRKLEAAGAVYYVEMGNPDRDPTVTIRLVCDWSVPDDEIGRFLDLVRAG